MKQVNVFCEQNSQILKLQSTWFKGSRKYLYIPLMAVMLSAETLFRKQLLPQKVGSYSTVTSFFSVKRVLSVFEFSNDNSNTTGENGLQWRQKTSYTNDTFGFFWVKIPSSLLSVDQNFVVPWTGSNTLLHNNRLGGAITHNGLEKRLGFSITHKWPW